MRYLGLDLGTKTLGLAISDLTNTIATPLKTIVYDDENKMIEQLLIEIRANEISVLILGFPKNMNNTIGYRAEATIEFKDKLKKSSNIEIILEDERLSSVSANRHMLEGNLSRKKRKQKIDGLAASIILQRYLDRK